MLRIPVLPELGHPLAKITPTLTAGALLGRGTGGDAPIRPGLARCECQGCGAHTNAVAAHHVYASCPNCGAARLVRVEGAQMIVPARTR